MSGQVLSHWGLSMLVVGWTAILGLGWATLIRPGSRYLERIALGYLLGLAVVVAVLLGWQLSGQRYALLPILGITLGLGAVPFVLARIRGQRDEQPPADPRGAGLIDPAIQVLLGIIVLVNLAVATYQPTLRWDELSHHMLAAKIFFHEGGITRESGMLTQDVRTYPPFVPLSRTWLYLLTGTDDPSTNHLVSWAMFASFLTLVQARLRHFVSSTTSLLFTVVAGLLMFWGGTESLIDFPLVTYGGLGVLFAASALRLREASLGLISGILFGVAGLVRPDGLSFGLMNWALYAGFAVITVRQGRALGLILGSALGLALALLPWVVFKSVFWNLSISAETYLGGGFGEMVFAAVRRGAIDFDALVKVVSFVFPVFNREYGYLLVLAILLIPLGLPDRRPNGFLCAALALNAVVWITALYAFLLAGRTDLALREETAIRFGTRLLPLLVFAIGTLPLVNEAVNRALRWRPRRSQAANVETAAGG